MGDMTQEELSSKIKAVQAEYHRLLSEYKKKQDELLELMLLELQQKSEK